MSSSSFLQTKHHSSFNMQQMIREELYGLRAIFLPGSDSRSGSCGTGVFFPRGTGNPLDSRKKQGCSSALIPARVAQALKLNFDEMGVVSPSLGGRFSLQHGTIQTSL
ncbi:hypothetical protein CK203_112663 [Vitis vinifera]|uniref:Uncharacterized protein n=1 Tax=Vitis vinifera TaxID=29760 RepID=A0A438C434_VITVI|nr:hypothetical protein CK203_112663 [Vitis vinifera]